VGGPEVPPPRWECLFCGIAAGKVPAQLVLERPQCMAFLDHRPLFKGHALLIPREHIGTLEELPDSLLPPFFGAARDLASAVQEAMEAEGTFVAMNNRVSQSVPHLHCHIVPRRKGDGLKGFFWPRTKYTSEGEMAETAQAIRKALGRIRY
jgi:histidine triad (HIT) family protein